MVDISRHGACSDQPEYKLAAVSERMFAFRIFFNSVSPNLTRQQLEFVKTAGTTKDRKKTEIHGTEYPLTRTTYSEQNHLTLFFSSHQGRMFLIVRMREGGKGFTL